MNALTQRLLIVALVALGGYCFWQATPGLLPDQPVAGNVHASAETISVPSHTRPVSLGANRNQRRSVTTPIQDLRVGMRVVGRNPLEDDAQRNVPQPAPETWRLVRARIEMGPGKFCDVELLRPLEWIEDCEAAPGSTIWLELPEMFVAGDADVLAIEACSPIDVGTNPIITGTFRHAAEQVVEVRVKGAAEPITCTSEHPFWSETHGIFVPASQLEVDEDVLTAYGNSARITSIVPRAGPQTVYGLEIYGEHVYHVGDVGILAHNASSKSLGVQFKRWKRGDAIDKPLPDGSAPTWGTVQSRYWKNRYRASKNTGEFSQANLDRIRKGNAPMDYNRRTGNWESRELHHVKPQRYTLDNSPLNLRELTPDWHAEVDPSRRVPGILPTRGIR